MEVPVAHVADDGREQARLVEPGDRLIRLGQHQQFEKFVADAFGRNALQLARLRPQRDRVAAALDQAIKDQKAGKTTLIEAMINQELGEPFRRDAMKKPVTVAGIDAADMADA